MKKLLFLLLFQTLSLVAQENCLELNGSSDYFLVQNGPNLGTSDFTIEAWVYITDSTGIGQKIINKGLTSVSNPSNAGYGLRMYYHNLQDLDFSIGDASGAVTRIEYGDVPANTWHHVAGVRKGKTLLLFLDGALVGTTTTAFIYNVDTDIPLSIGAIHKGGRSTTNEFLNGKIDEVRIWNKALSGTEIATNMNCKINEPTPNLQLVFNFDFSNSDVVLDPTGNDYWGILDGTSQLSVSEVAQTCEEAIDHDEVFDEPEELSIKIYPNPIRSGNILTIESNSSIDFINVFDGNGALVTQLTGNNISNFQMNIDIPSGLYYFQIQTNIGLKTKRLVVVD